MSPKSSSALDKETLLALYRTMQTIRQCEEWLAKSCQQGHVHGACHTYVGQEAIAAGHGRLLSTVPRGHGNFV